MQGRENTGESIVSRNMLENLYPGNCGYKSETGGIMKNLRESTTNNKVIIVLKGYILLFILV
jgi:Zn-dependent M16 (insulinase) family peptidase